MDCLIGNSIFGVAVVVKLQMRFVKPKSYDTGYDSLPKV
jgi:hypothetical protein